MRNIKLLSLLFVFLGLSTVGKAQDVHFSLYNMSPLSMNPALTGAFYGTVRVGAIYRNQYQAVGGFAKYSTPDLYIDAPIIRGFRKQDWVGIGANILQDETSIAKLKNTNFGLSGSYHFALDKQANSVLTFGAQIGFAQRKFGDKNRYVYEDEFFNNGTSVDDGNLKEKTGYTDYNVGLAYKAKLGKTAGLTLGFAWSHISRPKYNITNGDNTRLPSKFVGHGTIDFDIAKNLTLSPTFFMAFMNKLKENALQVVAGIKLNNEKNIKLNIGLGYRGLTYSDAAEFIAGIDYGQFRFMGCYDYTTSQIGQPAGNFELAASYIFNIYKKPKIKPVIICPRF